MQRAHDFAFGAALGWKDEVTGGKYLPCNGQRATYSVQQTTCNEAFLPCGLFVATANCWLRRTAALRSGRPSRAIAAAGSLFCFERTSPLIDKSSRHSVKTV